MKEIFLLPGQLAILTQPGLIRTVLGSCVAIVLYDLSNGIAGVNHYLLANSDSANEENRLRYGCYAIPALIYELLEHGASHKHLLAEVYGGAAVVQSLSNDFSIGDQNAQFARKQLMKWEIKLVALDVGGTQGRKIEFSSQTYQTTVKYIKSWDPAAAG